MKQILLFSSILIIAFSFSWREIPTSQAKQALTSGCEIINQYGEFNSDERGVTLLMDEEENLYIGGRKDEKAMLMKTTSDGNVDWAVTFTPSNMPENYILDMEFDGADYIIGSGWSSGTVRRGFIFKFNILNKSLEWVYSDPSFLGNHIRRLAPHPVNDSYLVGGMYHESASGNFHPRFFEVDKITGAVISNSTKKYKYLENTGEMISTFEIKDDAIYVSGKVSLSPNTWAKLRPAITKFDLNLNNQWTKYYAMPNTMTGRLYSNDIIVEDNHILQAGQGDFGGTSLTNVSTHITKVNMDGSLVWSKKYDVNSHYKFKPAEFKSYNNGYVVYGYNDSGALFLLNLDTNGDVIWAKNIATSVFLNSNNQSNDAFIIKDDYIYITGYGPIDETATNDIVVFKINLLEEPEDQCGFISDINVTVVDDPFNVEGVYNFTPSTTNQTQLNTFGQNVDNVHSYTANLCSPPTEETDCNNGLDDDCDGLVDEADEDCISSPVEEINFEQSVNIYPNPFKDIFTFEFSESSTLPESIMIVNAEGKKILEISGVLQKGTIDLTSYSSGIYYFSFSTPDGKIITKPLILSD